MEDGCPQQLPTQSRGGWRTWKEGQAEARHSWEAQLGPMGHLTGSPDPPGSGVLGAGRYLQLAEGEGCLLAGLCLTLTPLPSPVAAWQGVERDLRSQLSGGERGLVEEYVEKVPNPSLKSEWGWGGAGSHLSPACTTSLLQDIWPQGLPEVGAGRGPCQR